MAAIDYAASTFIVRTRAKGLLSKLAHDLELTTEDHHGDVEIGDDGVTGTLRFPTRGVRVVGALKGGRVDRGVLSASDVKEIEQRIRDELGSRDVEVKLEGTRERVQATVSTGRGSQRASVPIRSTDGDATVASGELSLSLRALGVKEIKGPLGAFKLDDRIEVSFRVALASDR